MTLHELHHAFITRRTLVVDIKDTFTGLGVTWIAQCDRKKRLGEKPFPG